MGDMFSALQQLSAAAEHGHLVVGHIGHPVADTDARRAAIFERAAQDPSGDGAQMRM